MTAKKQTVDQVMSAKINSDAAADGLMAAADAVVTTSAPAKPMAAPTIKADLAALAADAQVRGGIKLEVRAGTAVVRNVNASNTGISTGSAETLGKKHTLNLNSMKVTMNLEVL